MASRSINAPGLARLLGGPPAGRPLSTALAGGLRALVLDGRLPPHTRLPAERDLAAALGLSRTTVTSAYDLLRAEGYVASRRGAGSWTAPPPGRTMPARHRPAGDAALIDLACATPPAPCGFDESVAAAVAELPRYTGGPGYESLGLPVLRAAVADRYTARGVPTLPDQILVTTGAQHALCLVLQALARPGDAVLVESPTYPHALDALRRAGTRLVPAGVNGGWDLDLIAAGMRQAAVRLAYVVPDFQNPTGRLMDDAGRAALVAAARDTGAYLVVDETFAELAIDDLARPRPVAGHDTDGRVISIGSAAKVLWGGLRIGWIRATRALVRRLAEARETVDLASPVLEQLIVADLLGRMDDVVADRRAVLGEHRTALAGALRRACPGWEFTPPPGGLSLWVRLPGVSSTALAAAAPAHGLHVVPGTAFGVDGVLDDHLRVPFVLPPETLRDAADRLAAACRDAAAAPPPRRTFV